MDVRNCRPMATDGKLVVKLQLYDCIVAIVLGDRHRTIKIAEGNIPFDIIN